MLRHVRRIGDGSEREDNESFPSSIDDPLEGAGKLFGGGLLAYFAHEGDTHWQWTRKVEEALAIN